MKHFLLQIITDTTKVISNPKNNTEASPANYWMWIAAAEFLLIGYFVFKLVRSKKHSTFDGEAETVLHASKSSNVDMNDLMNSINKAGPLYKKLSAKCHPDRFVDNEMKRKEADNLFQEISRHKRNYSKLLELEQEAIRILNITH